jgi:hypothetical protein
VPALSCPRVNSNRRGSSAQAPESDQCIQLAPATPAGTRSASKSLQSDVIRPDRATRKSPANQPLATDSQDRLKIVVSSVRFRVSPFLKIAANWRVLRRTSRAIKEAREEQFCARGPFEVQNLRVVEGFPDVRVRPQRAGHDLVLSLAVCSLPAARVIIRRPGTRAVLGFRRVGADARAVLKTVRPRERSPGFESRPFRFPSRIAPFCRRLSWRLGRDRRASRDRSGPPETA